MRVYNTSISLYNSFLWMLNATEYVHYNPNQFSPVFSAYLWHFYSSSFTSLTSFTGFATFFFSANLDLKIQKVRKNSLI